MWTCCVDPFHSSEGSLTGRDLMLPELLGTFPAGFCAEDCPSGDYGEGKERKLKRPVDCGQWRDGVEVLSSLKTAL